MHGKATLRYLLYVDSRLDFFRWEAGDAMELTQAGASSSCRRGWLPGYPEAPESATKDRRKNGSTQGGSAICSRKQFDYVETLPQIHNLISGSRNGEGKRPRFKPKPKQKNVPESATATLPTWPCPANLGIRGWTETIRWNQLAQMRHMLTRKNMIFSTEFQHPGCVVTETEAATQRQNPDDLCWPHTWHQV